MGAVASAFEPLARYRAEGRSPFPARWPAVRAV